MEELIAKTTAVAWFATCIGLAILLLIVAITFNLFLMGKKVLGSNLNLPKVIFTR